MAQHASSPDPRVSGPWGMGQVEDFLQSAIIPVRIATAGRSGPLVQSMWFVWDEATLWCATQSDALITRRLSADPRCGFEVAGDAQPYRGVRGQGIARVEPGLGPSVLGRLIDRYLGSTQSGLARWLLARSEHEVALAIRPQHLATWDYSARMRD